MSLASDASNAPKPGKRSVSHAADTQNALIDAAICLFAERGYAGVSVRQLAERAGVSHGAVRHHFGGKSEIYRQALDRVFAQYLSQMSVQLADQTNSPADQQLYAIVRHFLRVTLKREDYVKLMINQTGVDAENQRYAAERFTRIHEQIEPVFEQARQLIPRLNNLTNDTFFYALASMSYFYILHPQISTSWLGIVDQASHLEKIEQTVLIQLFGDHFS